MHEHSLLAERQERPKFSSRAQAIWCWIEAHGRPVTDREVMTGMGYTDMNSVRPRCTELVRAGMLEEVDSVKCSVTGKLVRRLNVRCAGAPQRELPL